MLEDQTKSKQTLEEGWTEVGKQFEALGQGLARALRGAWQNEETRRHVQALREGMEKMVSEVDRAVEDAARSPQADKFREQAAQTAESLRIVGEKAWREAQPHLLSALTKINAELNGLVDRMDRRGTTPWDSAEGETSSEPPEQGGSDAQEQ